MWLAVAGLVETAWIHAALVGEHLEEMALLGAGFALSALICAACAFFMVRRRSEAAWALGSLACAGMAYAYVVSRVSGLGSMEPEAWDLPGLVALSAEGVVVAGFCAVHVRPALTARRLKALAVALAVVAAGAPLMPTTASASHVAFSQPLHQPQVIDASAGGTVSLSAEVADVPILPGTPTEMWTYNGTFPGPTIRQRSGTPVTVAVTNNLPSTAGKLSVHNHGNHSKPQFDGGPMDNLIPTGGSYSYVYDGMENGTGERGAQQWYHDHVMDQTARNVWMGLAGMYLIDDPADPQTLPSGQFEVPLMLTDRSFTAGNQLSYTFNPSGVTGDHILVNGRPQPYFEVGPTKYRLRVLNASNIRDYEIALSNGRSLLQVGTESGLLAAPVPRSSILLNPAERADVVVDFAGFGGQNVVLRNLSATGAAGELLQFRVTGSATNASVVPASLRTWPDLSTEEVAARRTFTFDRKQGSWTINGKMFDPARIDARPVLGTTEEWTLVNPSGWNHVVHIHDVDQQLMSRNGAVPQPYERNKESWHIGGGQTVVVRLKFTDHTGPYVFHCHVLEHEDDGMMSQFEVVASPGTSVSTGLRSATATQAANGNGFERDPTGAFGDGGLVAADLDGPGHSQTYSGFSFAGVPAGAVVTGIEVRADWWVDQRRGTNTLGVALSSDGSIWTPARSATGSSTSERTSVLGASDDLWGREWTRAQLDSLRVRVSTASTVAGRDFFLDWLPVTIHYRVP